VRIIYILFNKLDQFAEIRRSINRSDAQSNFKSVIENDTDKKVQVRITITQNWEDIFGILFKCLAVS